MQVSAAVAKWFDRPFTDYIGAAFIISVGLLLVLAYFKFRE